jgi:hypothetical protein
LSDLEELESALGEALRGLKKYRELVARLLGDSEEERRLMLRAAKGLSSTEIRVALEEYQDRRRH